MPWEERSYNLLTNKLFIETLSLPNSKEPVERMRDHQPKSGDILLVNFYCLTLLGHCLNLVGKQRHATQSTVHMSM